MSTATGTIATGVITPEDAKEAADKAAAARDAKEYATADKALVSSLKAGEKAVQKIADALATAAELELHKHTTNPDTGRPYTSFTAYVQSRTAEFPLIHRVVRKELVKVLTEAGHSVRQIAAAVQASPGSVVNDQQEAGLREKATTTDTDADAQKIARIVKGAATALGKVRDAVQDMTDEELATIMAELTDTRAVVAGMRKLRSDAASKGKGKSSAPKPTPATVAASGPQRTPVAATA